MDLVLKGRGVEVTERVRRIVERKLGKIERFGAEVSRVEVLIEERNPRLGGSHRVEVSCDARGHVLRAEGAGQDVESALDQVVDRLQRQIETHKGKRKNRLPWRSDRLRSKGTSPGEVNPSE